MKIRLAIILSGSLLVSAAGGLLAAMPVIRAAEDAVVPVDSAPTPELEIARRTVLDSLQSSKATIEDRLAQLELLAELMATAGAHPRASGEDAVARRLVTLESPPLRPAAVQ